MTSRPDPTAGSRGGGGPERLGRSARRDMLLDVAAVLVSDGDPHAVTMDLVAERAGVSRPLVYKHFANRDDLLAALYEREAQRLHLELSREVDAADSIEGMFRALVSGALRAADEHGRVFATLRTGNWGREVRREQRARDSRTAQAFTRRAAEELGVAPESAATTVSLLLALVDPVLSQWRRRPTQERRERLEESYMTIVRSTLRELAEPRS